ncbi:MAG: hypothetical protein ABI378_01355 [Chitinophagaceae bacterium]
MKKNVLLLMVAALITTTLFYSCKKDDNNATQSRKDLIIGTWNVNAYGVDDNMDGTLEVSEYDTIPPGVALIQTYRADGTGVFTTQSPGTSPKSTNITYSLINGDQTLHIVTEDNQVTDATITEMTEHRLQGYDVTSNPRIVFLLTK